MTQAVTSAEAYGFQADEALTYKFWQVLVLYTTGLNTDTTYDFGAYVAGSLGTFWTAVSAGGAGTPGYIALQLMQSIAPLINGFLTINGPTLEPLVKQGLGGVQQAVSTAITNATSATATVPGLLATDIILSVNQSTANTGGIVPDAFGAPGAGTLPLTYASAPGTGGEVTVSYIRPVGTVAPNGGYTETVVNAAPNITFTSGDAPTTGQFYLLFDLKGGSRPVLYPIPKP